MIVVSVLLERFSFDYDICTIVYICHVFIRMSFYDYPSFIPIENILLDFFGDVYFQVFICYFMLTY